MKNNHFLLLLIWSGIIEGLSTLILFFIAMPMKYIYEMPIAVTIAGNIHGFLFIELVLLFTIARFKGIISSQLMWVGFLSAIIPFGPFVIDLKLLKLLNKIQ